ncbi:MAG TPA: S8 family peptidase [Candidatus Paceibacterota bacterium]|nr:S8 family peptidase [Verrucomicrobiota bacterium]HRY47174.1 S8 family peptidase [Candidatus Paceibacterota bacterium]
MPKKKSSKNGSARAVASSADLPRTQGQAKTIIYVHGIGNKPPADVLKCQWDTALFGFDLGERSRLAYWVNRLLYPEPLPGNCRTSDVSDLGRDEVGAMGAQSQSDVAVGVEQLLPPDAHSTARESMRRLAKEMLQPSAADRPGFRASDYGPRVLPLPKKLRDFFTRQITKRWLKDVYEFFFDEERREVMRRSLEDRLLPGGGPFVVIGHSQGSMIAYDVLSRMKKTDAAIELFLTVGSPLGLKEVQDQLKRLTGQNGGLQVPAVARRWVNVADPLDPVCADKRLAGDYRPSGQVAVEDYLRWNLESPKDPHSGSGYLGIPVVHEVVHGTVQPDLFQRIAPFTIARDVVRLMETGPSEERHPVLIELREKRAPHQPAMTLSQVRDEVTGWIRQTMELHRKRTGMALTEEEMDLEVLQNFVGVNLTRSEIERLSEDLSANLVYRVFRNGRKTALLNQSVHTVQARTAHLGYGALGQDITWAVLDSGIDWDHPHFAAEQNVLRVFDCLKTGKVIERQPGPNSQAGLDRNGHGTHVAGIIAGSDARLEIFGVAPRTRLISYKVLDDEGYGNDAKIIKALDHVFETNLNAPQQVIHGVNLSLGGAFDPQVFGCGDSPLCKQLRKLWRQGVVVVIAAGNEGYLELQQGEQTSGINMDLSIGDPANLDEAIAVGSIHKTKPHLYGVSFFSSRGPTADGRSKPDLVAPGEQILSCRAGARPQGKDDTEDRCYVRMSGTSMAAPHVSGIIAGFLSARREFIGFPEKVKTILLDNCTDLRRDRMHQGAGMPNLVRMLLNS